MGILLSLIERLFEIFLNRHMKKHWETMKSVPQPTGGKPNSHELMLNAYRKGDYRNVHAMICIGSGAGMDLGAFRGDVLMQLGHFEEADTVFSQAVANEKEPKLLALANCMHGELFVHRKDYDKARECFATALNLWPERPATHRCIAELWLRRGDNPAAALQWAEIAVEKERADEGITAETKTANLAEDLATLAWAVAVSSQDAGEVEKLTSEAVVLCGMSIAATSAARTHVYSGMAYKALGKEAKSAQHFEAAARVDPSGVWGREALELASTSPSMTARALTYDGFRSGRQSSSSTPTAQDADDA